MMALQQTLSDIIDGFSLLELEGAGRDVRILKVLFAARSENDAKPASYELDFSELSDGQRALIALYTLLRVVRRGATICIDEPDNYVSLQELQPWLFSLLDRIDDEGGQAILVSHHPELINLLAPEHGVVFSREHGGPTRLLAFPGDLESSLSPAERVARGWDRG